jgi:hypothetical protein
MSGLEELAAVIIKLFKRSGAPGAPGAPGRPGKESSSLEIINRAQPLQDAIEGDYSSYTLKWHVADSLGMGAIGFYSFNEAGDRVFIHDESSLDVLELRLSDGVEMAGPDIYQSITAGGTALTSSVLQKYMVRTDTDDTKIVVYKDGAILQTITVPAGARVRNSVIISPDGKYIIALNGIESKLICYEGQT